MTAGVERDEVNPRGRSRAGAVQAVPCQLVATGGKPAVGQRAHDATGEIEHTQMRVAGMRQRELQAGDAARRVR